MVQTPYINALMISRNQKPGRADQYHGALQIQQTQFESLSDLHVSLFANNMPNRWRQTL